MEEMDGWTEDAIEAIGDLEDDFPHLEDLMENGFEDVEITIPDIDFDHFDFEVDTNPGFDWHTDVDWTPAGFGDDSDDSDDSDDDEPQVDPTPTPGPDSGDCIREAIDGAQIVCLDASAVRGKSLSKLGLTPVSIPAGRYISNGSTPRPAKKEGFMKRAFKHIGALALAKTRKEYKGQLMKFRDFCSKYIADHPNENITIPAPPAFNGEGCDK